jgi:methylated-DNA-[protein]-cysteine S-methyltransferase
MYEIEPRPLLAESARLRLAQTCTAQLRVTTPLGGLLLARSALGLAGAWFDGQTHHPGELRGPQQADDPLLGRTARWVADYFEGRATAFDVPLDLLGTPFQRAVWAALLAIPAGATRSYGELARGLGSPAAVRAIGAAVGRNPACVIVPCHRVIGSDGSLTGYAGGVARKRALLALEGGFAAA